MLKIDIHKTYASKKRKSIIHCQGEFELGVTSALYGKSGIGKSTILRLIAGLETPDSGSIKFGNQFWYDAEQKINLPIRDRNIGFVFQEFNLFPNMTVEGNLCYASEKQLSKRTKDLIEIAEIGNLMKSYPNELSGGEKQRVAIVRALCQSPELLLLDEPFSALDDDAIGELIAAFKRLQFETGITVIVVSHRKDVIIEMATNVVHIKDDRTIVQGNPRELLKRSF